MHANHYFPCNMYSHTLLKKLYVIYITIIIIIFYCSACYRSQARGLAKRGGGGLGGVLATLPRKTMFATETTTEDSRMDPTGAPTEHVNGNHFENLTQIGNLECAKYVQTRLCGYSGQRRSEKIWDWWIGNAGGPVGRGVESVGWQQRWERFWF